MTVTAGEEFVLPERFRAKVLRRRGDGGAPTPITESSAEFPAELPAEMAVRALAESYGVGAANRPRWDAAVHLLALLADVTDAEYSEAMAAASQYRNGTREQRALTSFLFRERTDWVDADLRCDAVLDGRPRADLACWLLAAALTTADQAREFAARQHWRKWPAEEVVPTMLASVGTAVTPLVLAWLDDEWYRDEDDHQRLLALVSELGTEESIRALTERLCWKSVQSHLFAGGGLYPRRTLRVLAETDPEEPGGVVEERHRTLWTRHVEHALVLHATTYAEAAREELPALSPAARARVEAALAPRRDLPDAPAATLPRVLAAPPWTNRDAVARPAVIKGLTAPTGASVVWAEGEREEWLATRFRDQPHSTEPDDAAIAARLADKRDFRLWQQYDGTWRQTNFPRFFCRAAEDLVRPLLEAGRQAPSGGREGWTRVYLARFELLALPMTFEASGPNRLAAVQPFRSPETAVFVAESFIQRKAGRADAVRWLTRHADYAAEQLIPAAVGKPGRSRQVAARTLRWLGDRNGTDVVAIAAEAYGDEAAAAIKALMVSDGGEELPKTLPKVPRWAESFALPQIVVTHGAAGLPPEAVHHLGQMLALSASGEPYSGIEDVKEFCDAVSLREYAWALFDNWRLAGYPNEFAWALTALRWFGDDEIVRRLAPLVRVWPGEGGHTRAVNALDVFAEIGTDLALTTLSSLSQRLRFKGLKERAGEKIAEIAENLGLTAEQLADRLAPDLGLAADGTLTLDFGPRRFVAGFDAELKPYVRDETGRRLRALPKPGANDDPELAKAATASFSALKKEARTVVADQVARLERAMVMRRRWTPAEFSAFFVRHPLVRHIARQVVWATFDAQGAVVRTFRVAEDQTFADLDDELFTLSEGALIGVAHPLDLGASIGRWSDVLADYQILQPFAQLGRQPHILTEDERASLVLKRFAKIEMPAGRVLGLTRRGWRRGEPWGDGYEMHIERPLPDGRVVIADIRPGIAVGFASEAEDQSFADIWVSRDGEADYRPVPEWSDPFGTLDPVTASEILRDLTEVTAQ